MSRRDEWDVTRLKYIVDYNVHTLPEDTDPDWSFTYIDIGNVSQGRMTTDGEVSRFANAPSRARRRAVPGDTVVSTVRTYLRAVATVPHTDKELVFSTGFAVLHPRPVVDSTFLSYYLQGDEFVDRVVANSTGVSYPAITATDLVTMQVRLPTMEEQRDIARFLDRETVKIDALIAEQEGLVAVLHERRRAMIERAVTRGLGKDTLTDSGVPWLGAVKTGWDIIRARYLVRIQTGYGDTVDAEPDGEYPFYVRSQTPLRSTGYDYDGPAVLTAGDGAGVAKVFHLVDGKFKAHQRVYVMNRFKRVIPPFFFYFFSTFFAKVALDGSAKSTVDSVRRPMIADMPFTVPPVREQRQIAAYLNEETEKIDALIAEAEGMVAVAKERRSALITAAVTGQIDVRGEVA